MVEQHGFKWRASRAMPAREWTWVVVAAFVLLAARCPAADVVALEKQAQAAWVKKEYVRAVTLLGQANSICEEEYNRNPTSKTALRSYLRSLGRSTWWVSPETEKEAVRTLRATNLEKRVRLQKQADMHGQEYQDDLKYLGQLLRESGDHTAAVYLYRELADETRRELEAGAKKGPNPKLWKHIRKLAYHSALTDLASALIETGEYGQAASVLEEAVELVQRNDGAASVDWGEGSWQYRGTLQQQAGLLVKTGDFDQAERVYRRVIDLTQKAQAAEALKPPNERSVASLTYLYDALAEMYTLSGQLRKVEPLLIECVQIERKNMENNADITWACSYAQALFHLAEFYRSAGRIADARALVEEALTIQKRAFDTRGLVIFYFLGLNHAAELAAAAGDTALATARWSEAADLCRRESGENENLAQYQARMGDMAARDGSVTQAEALYREAIRMTAAGGAIEAEARHRSTLAGLLAGVRRPSDAAREYKAAADLLERVRASMGSAEERMNYQNARDDVYGRLAVVLAGEGKTSEAFDAVERGRAKSLLDLIGTREVRGARSEPETGLVIRMERQLAQVRRELAGLDGGLNSPSMAQPVGDKTRSVKRAAALAEIDELDHKRMELIGRIAKADPEQGAILAVDPPRLEEVQATLGTTATLVELFHPGGGELWSFVVSDRRCELTTVPVSQATLTDTLTTLSTLMSDAAANRDEVTSLSAAVHGWLVAPIADQIKTDTVIVVPWGPLFKVPPAALAPRGGEPWGVERNIVVAPAAGLYRYIVKKRASGRGSVFVLGNPDTVLSPLPGAEKEAAEVGALFQQSSIKTRREATKGLLKSAIGPGRVPDVVHLACHGIFNERVPQLSYLALTPEKDDNGKLEMHEVYGLNWRGVSLVTLSACSSGKAKLGFGNDIVGMVRGFIFAGAPSVLCSLWDVDDEATRALMVEFYKQYLAGKTKPEALRLAQTAVRTSPAHPEWKHPYYWAAFVLFGDWV